MEPHTSGEDGASWRKSEGIGESQMESEEVTGSPKECETRVTDGADHSISLQENTLSGKLQSLERATDVRTLKSSDSEEFGYS